jgi:hypothetical protein
LIWEKVDHVKTTTEMKNTLRLSANDEPNHEPSEDKWPQLASTWPKLVNNQFLPGTPINPQPTLRYVTRNARYNNDNALPGLIDSKRDLQDFIDTLVSNLEKRLLSNEDEMQLTEHVRTLTSYTDLANIASTHEEELFVTRVLDQKHFWDASQFMVHLDDDLNETAFLKQVKTFLHRVYPFMKAEATPDNKGIIGTFCKDPTLYDTIPDFLHCVLSACIKGAVESVVESMGSKLEHHNKPERHLTPEHVNEAVFVSWNGPEIHHCDNVLRGALERHFCGKEWHFVICQPVKAHRVSEAVDFIQRPKCKIITMVHLNNTIANIL